MRTLAIRIATATLYVAVMAGCATSSLSSARRDYFGGRYQDAARQLEQSKFPARDRVLFKMERGMIRQAAGDFEGSTRDFVEAFDAIDQMTAISVSQDTGSMVINDNVQDFRGDSFEQTLTHTFTAKNHLMQSNWENAAVEARRIINSMKPEVKKGYPEDAYSRYMAGFCLGLIGDWSNAALQYRLAQPLLKGLTIDERTGWISPGTNVTSSIYPETKPITNGFNQELVVFVLIGRSPTGDELFSQRRPISPPGYAEIIINGQTVGRSYALADTVDLAFTTKEKDALKETAKTMARIAMKEAAAISIEQQDELLGAIFRLVMIGLLEQPDVRRWETLPRSLQVARVPAPDRLEDVQVRFMSSGGAVRRTTPLPLPLPRKDRTYIGMIRDIQPVL